MAIPVGTTSRQLCLIARWSLVWLMVLGPLSWWWVGYRSWGGLTAGMLVVMGLWLMWRTAADNRTVPGHPLHVILVVPAAILAWHFVKHSMAAGSLPAGALGGELDLSMLFHLGLLALAVMLTQSLLPAAARHVVGLAVCGLAMMVGPVTAVAWQQTLEARNALAMQGFAGVAVWLSLLWGLAPSDDGGPVPHALRRRDLRLACIGLATAASVVMARMAPEATVRAGTVVGLAMISGALLFRRHRVVLLVVGGVLSAGGLHVTALLTGSITGFDPAGAGWFGGGEEAFGRLSAGSNGVAILLATIGWAGLVWVVGGGCLCVGWLLRQGVLRGADQGRSVVWLAATGLATASLLSGGGAFMPTGTLIAAFTWGMLPAMLGSTPKRRPGIVLLVPILALMLAMGMAWSSGLVVWMVKSFGWGDKMLHGVSGMLLAAVLAWLLGSRCWWRGLLAIVAAALAGGAGELAQRVVASWRGADLADWGAHAAGSALVVIPYLLCMGSRLCESADVIPGAAAAAEDADL